MTDVDTSPDVVAPETAEPQTLDQMIEEAAQAASEPSSGSPSPSETPASETPPTTPKRIYELSGLAEGVDVPDLDGLKFSFQAKGETRERDLYGLVRDAQKGVALEANLATTRGERDQALERLRELEPEVADLRAKADLWNRALADDALMERLKAAYKEAGGETRKAPTEEPPKTETPPSREAQLQEYVDRGVQGWSQTGLEAHVEAVSEAYGADVRELTETILTRLGQEPPEFLSWDKVGQIVNEELPALLEEAGYTSSADVSPWGLPTAGPARRSGGLTPKAERQTSDADRRAAILREAEALGLKVVDGEGSDDVRETPPPGPEGQVAPVRPVRPEDVSRSGPAAKSDLLDVSEAKSFADIQRALEKL